MITIKDMNERWLKEVKDYIIDSTIREYNIAHWDFLTSQVDNLEDYSSDRKDALAFDVKGMGYADYDEIGKAFKKLGHDDLDAQDFSEDIYEICQFDNEIIFHDIEDYLEVPFYAMGRMGGHWGVLCEDVCDKDLVDVEINEKELWKYIEKNYDLNDYDDIWDIDCEDVGRYADENCFNFVADKDFIKHLNDAWDEIKKQSDYMLTYDYAEYIAERLIEDNFLESKTSPRKSIKESVEFSKEKDIYIARIKDSSVSFVCTPINTDGNFNGYIVFDGDDAIQYLNWKGGDVNDILKGIESFEDAIKRYASKSDAKTIIKYFSDKLGI